MDRILLTAQKREVLGKKVKVLRKQGFLPAHVFGKSLDSEHISVSIKEFKEVFKHAGETGLIDLKIDGQTKPVLVRGVQFDPLSDQIIHADFYQVNLKEKVKVPVPLSLVGEEPELVQTREAIVLQTVTELEVEALPTDLVENIEIDISILKQIDDAIFIKDLEYNREKLTINADPEEIVVKLAPAVTEEMQKLLEEQAAETAEAQAEEAAEVAVEGEAVSEEAQAAGEQEEVTDKDQAGETTEQQTTQEETKK